MAPTLEGGVHESVNNLYGEFGRDEAGRKHQTVGIVVLSGKFAQLHVPAKSRTHALMLVHGHADAVAAATDSYCRIHLATLESESAGMRIIGIIA